MTYRNKPKKKKPIEAAKTSVEDAQLRTPDKASAEVPSDAAVNLPDSATSEVADAPLAGPAPFTLLDILEKKFPDSSRTKLRELIAAKRVLVNGRLAITLKQPVAPTVSIDVLPRVEARARVAGNVPFRVVFEDADLLVIDKPAGAITSSGPGDQRATVIDILTDHYARIDDRIVIGLIHRLDKDASGLLVFSKNSPTYTSLKEQFAAKSAERTYHAIVLGEPMPKKGMIKNKLVELADGKVRATTHTLHGEEAITHYRTLETRGRHALLEVRLETGRKHQIRVHLAEGTWPIAGDVLYHEHANMAPRLMLHAIELSVEHPRTGERMTFRSEPPAPMLEWWEGQKPKSVNRPPRNKKK